MTGQGAQGGGGGRAPMFRVGAGVAGLVGLVAGIVQILSYLGVTPGAGGGQPSQSTTMSAATPTATFGQQSAESAGANSGQNVGCFDGARAVSCAAPHAVEVVDLATCTPVGLVSYMGGVSGVDVLTVGVRTEKLGSACKVTWPWQVTESMKGSLAGSANGFRLCLAENRAVLPCGQDHRIEVVYVATSGTESPNCEQKAGTYLGVPVASRDQELGVLPEGKIGGLVACSVTVLEPGRQLTSSLRNLRTLALPVR